MSSLLLLLLGSVLITVIVIEHVPRWRPFVGLDDVFESARGIALAAGVAVPVMTAASHGLSRAILVPFDLGYLRTLAFAALALAIAQLAERAVAWLQPHTPARPAFHVLMIGNGVLLGVALSVDARARGFGTALVLGVACAAAFGFMLLTFAAMLERVRQADIPRSFRHAPIAALTAGFAALAFMGFAGLIQE